MIDHNKYPDPEKRSAHGGTFTGNPISMVAGSATIDALADGKIHRHIDSLGGKMRAGLIEMFERHEVPISVTGVGSTFGIHFQKDKPMNAGDTARNDIPATRGYFRYMLESSIIYLSPTVSHSWISSPHTEKDVEKYLAATEDYIRAYKP